MAADQRFVVGGDQAIRIARASAELNRQLFLQSNGCKLDPEKVIATFQGMTEGKLTPFGGGLRGRFIRTMPILIGGVPKLDLVEQVKAVRELGSYAESMIRHDKFETLSPSPRSRRICSTSSVWLTGAESTSTVGLSVSTTSRPGRTWRSSTRTSRKAKSCGSRPNRLRTRTATRAYSTSNARTTAGRGSSTPGPIPPISGLSATACCSVSATLFISLSSGLRLRGSFVFAIAPPSHRASFLPHLFLLKVQYIFYPAATLSPTTASATL